MVFSAADAYGHNVANRDFLFLSIDKRDSLHVVEVSFAESNFKHLTGFQTKLAPRHFFSLCVDRRLKESDFEFAADGTTQLKLQVLPLLVRSDLSARMIGDYNGSRLKLHTEKVAGGIRASIGFVQVGKGTRYVPNTLLNEDVRSLATKPDRIVLTCRKRHGEEGYSEVVFRVKNVDWLKMRLPDEHRYLLDFVHA